MKNNKNNVEMHKPRNSFIEKQNRKKMEELLFSPSPITEFKKVPSKNSIICSLEDGTRHIIPVDCSLQLYYDKMKMHPNVQVDFGKDTRNLVEILPYQNKVVYRNGTTGEIIKSLCLADNLIFTKTDSIKGSYVNYDSRLNPAVLAILDDNASEQNDYINATGNINIIYNFEEKSEKKRENSKNKNLAKTMNNYYKSEKKYAQELELQNKLSQKIGYVNMLDKVSSSINETAEEFIAQTNIEEETNNQRENIASVFQHDRDELIKSLKPNNNSTNNNPTTYLVSKKISKRILPSGR